MKVRIVSDSTCDLSPELLERYQIEITPLSVLLGNTIGQDGVSIRAADIVEYVSQSGNMAKTSAVNTEEYLSVFRRWHNQGYAIVQFCLSNEMSSSYKNACAAAKEVGDVYVVDTRNLSTGSGLLVVRAAEMAKQGIPAGEIAKICEKLTHQVEASFVIDQMDYLCKGGRCSALAGFGANLLRIKPCIEVVNGKMQTGNKYRGPLNHVITKYVEDRLTDRNDLDLSRVFITHSPCSPETVEAARQTILKIQPGFQEIIETNAGAVITSHCGPGTLGVLFLRSH